MATATGKCGKASITYDTKCTWLCGCDSKGCNWTIHCPGPDGGYDISGEGRMKNPDGQPPRAPEADGRRRH